MDTDTDQAKLAPCGVCRYGIPDQLPAGWTMLPRPLDRTFIRVDDACPTHAP